MNNSNRTSNNTTAASAAALVGVSRLAWSLVLAVLCLGAVQPASAQPNNTQPRPGRFLFLVEKSEAAGRTDEAIRQAVFDLIYKGANGNMAFGSIFEIWTFNDSVTTRGFEAAQLLYETRLDTATKATLFLRALPNEGKANMEALTEVLRRVAAGNDQLTVFMITEGGVPISGTPIDEQLNDIYSVHYPSMRQNATPFITTLRLRDGGIAAYAVSADVASLAMPPMPDRLPVANRPRTPPTTQESPAAPTRRAPVESIIITAETRSEPVATNAPPVDDLLLANAESPITEAEEAAPVEPLMADEEVATDSSTPAEEVSTSTPQPAVSSVPESQATAEPENYAPSEPLPTNAPQGEPARSVVVEEGPPTTVDVSEAPAVEDREQPVPIVTEPPAADPTLPSEPATVETAPSEAASQAVEPAATADSNGERDDGVVAVTGLEWLRSGGLFVAGTIFLLLALFFAWMLYRRTRRIADASLISKTYGRDRDRR